MSLDLTLNNLQFNFKMDNSGQNKIYEFEDFRLDAAHKLLYRGGEQVALTPKAVETLIALVERQNEVISKNELMGKIWADTIVEESNLAQYLHILRKNLGEMPDGKPYIETLKRRGYRFNGAARVSENSNGSPPPEVAEIKTYQTNGSNGHRRRYSGLRPLRVEQRENLQEFADWQEKAENPKEIGDVAPRNVNLLNSTSNSELKPRFVAAEEVKADFETALVNREKGRQIIIAASAGLLVLLIIAVFVGRQMRSGETEQIEKNAAGRTPATIAVLPFKLIGQPTGDNEYLGLATADALINRLGNVRQIIVRPTGSVRRYADTEKDLRAIGREQQVEAVLDGNVQILDNRLRLTAQLIRVADGATLWTGSFDETAADRFAAQTSIAQQIVQSLQVELSDAERQQVQKRGSENSDAVQAYLEGRHFWNKRSGDGYDKAVEKFSKAIALDPNYAQARAGLADAFLFQGGNGMSLNEAIQKARAAAQRAITLDENLSEVAQHTRTDRYESRLGLSDFRTGIPPRD